MTTIHTLGFPRIGEHRELKFALERYWRGEISAAELEQTGQSLRARHWGIQQAAGLAFVTVGDFAFYDQMANHIQWFGCEPARFGFDGNEAELERYFAMARGVRTEHTHSHSHDCGCAGTAHAGAQAALEMTKWFDTNYHYLVPEFDAATRFSLHADRLLAEVAEAQVLGYKAKPVLIGPLTFLWLGKVRGGDFDRLELLESLIQVYVELLGRLRAAGIDWVQIDEPVLGLDLPEAWRQSFERVYWRLGAAGVKVLLATYFSPLQENLRLACQLPVAGLHIDAVRAGDELNQVLDWLPNHKILSIGIVDGRNIWRTDLDRAIETLQPALYKRPGGIWLAPSCSLLHVPFSLAEETGLDGEIRSWLAFACEKLEELHVLQQLIDGDIAAAAPALQQNRMALAGRRSSRRVHDAAVSARLASLPPEVDRRQSPFAVRQAAQRRRFNLPSFPTTTIGSFPQTAAIRAARAAWRQGRLDDVSYRQQMRDEIAAVVAKQEQIGLDVLVHGEAERNDMVEYFGEQLAGFAFTRNGWVQSYGSRCVKPPIIYGDVSRPAPMTVEWARYAQSLTQKPMKGMLTGPVTILQWSFVRDDQPRSVTALQIALAIRDEVVDLEQAGIGIIQIDEPAVREGLPLRKGQWQSYLDWATRAFRVSASGVADDTQIHTHMCYAEFNDILPAIAAMDADVITIETSRSAMELLQGFGRFNYPNEIGPGVYDIHSPRVPSVEEMLGLLKKACQVVPPEHVWVNPDCGLKTRGWEETEAALAGMVQAARALRASHGDRDARR